MIGKLKSVIEKLRDDIISFVPLKGMMLSIEGAGASDPTIKTSYNVTSAARTAIGVYQITLKQSTFFGVLIGSKGVPTLSFDIAPSATSDFFTVEIVEVFSNIFELKVFEVAQGTGNRLDITPYDILVNDNINTTILLNVGNGRLPPE